MNASEASLKITVGDVKLLSVGKDSIVIWVDGRAIKPIALGESTSVAVSPGAHTVQIRISLPRSLFTFFMRISRKSNSLELNVAAGEELSLLANYNRTWGNFELQVQKA